MPDHQVRLEISARRKNQNNECYIETVVGDRWTVLTLRELLMGMRRFEQIQAQTGGTPQMMAARLKKLEADGLIKRSI